jgi:hypothetical protein
VPGVGQRGELVGQLPVDALPLGQLRVQPIAYLARVLAGGGSGVVVLGRILGQGIEEVLDQPGP